MSFFEIKGVFCAFLENDKMNLRQISCRGLEQNIFLLQPALKAMHPALKATRIFYCTYY